MRDIREDIWEDSKTESLESIGNPFLIPDSTPRDESQYTPGWESDGMHIYSSDEWREWFRPI